MSHLLPAPGSPAQFEPFSYRARFAGPERSQRRDLTRTSRHPACQIGRSGRTTWPDSGSCYLVLEAIDLFVHLGEGRACHGHAGVLRADETGVGCYGVAHPLDGAVELRVELPAEHLAEALAQRVSLLPELPPRLAALVGKNKEPVARDYGGGYDARHVEEAGRGERHDDGADADGPDLGHGGLGDGPLYGGGELLRLAFTVVALHDARGVLAHGVQQLAPVILEAVADLPDQTLVVARLPPALDVLHDHAPLLEVSVDHPVDELVDPLVYEVLGVCDDLPLEALLHLLLAQELAKVHQPDVLLQPRIAALVERVDDVLDLGEPRLEVALHVLLVEPELGLHVLRGLEVVFQQAQALVYGCPVAPGQLLDHTERALELEPHPALLVQELRHVTLELGEAARPQQSVAFDSARGGPTLACQQGGDEEDGWCEAEG